VSPGETGAAPTHDLEQVRQAQIRFEAATASLDDAAVAEPCRLPGWTVGHLLAHVARNADSHVRRSQAAARGEVVDQYPGGFEGRAAEIERDARRPAAVLVADVHDSAQRLDEVWRSLPEEAWAGVTRDVGGRERPVSGLVARRWQELEVHRVDLAPGDAHREWSDAFVARFLPLLRASRDERLPAGAVAPAPGALDERDELAWLYGRLDGDARTGGADLPELAPWS